MKVFICYGLKYFFIRYSMNCAFISSCSTDVLSCFFLHSVDFRLNLLPKLHKSHCTRRSTLLDLDTKY